MPSEKFMRLTIAELKEKKDILVSQLANEDSNASKAVWNTFIEEIDEILEIKIKEEQEKMIAKKIEEDERKKQKAMEKAIEEEKRRILMAEEEERRMAIVRAEAAKRAEEARKLMAIEAEKRRIEEEQRAIEEAEKKRKEEAFNAAVLARMEEIILQDIEEKERIHKEAMKRLATPEIRQKLMEELYASGKIAA
jgi:hypothetical protein